MSDDLVKHMTKLIAAGLDRVEQLTAERERLALAICGGEDAPGYANAQTVETLEHVAKQNQQSHGATINSLLATEAERDEALNQLDSAIHSVEVLEKRVAEVMADRESWQQAFSAQSAKLQIALDVGGEPVRAALKGEGQ